MEVYARRQSKKMKAVRILNENGGLKNGVIAEKI